MKKKEICYFGKNVILACDNKCHKAFGMNTRQRDSDDNCICDDDLGIAPVDPGTYEGGYGKPCFDTEKLNKWCCRECERSSVFEIGEEIILPTFEKE